MQVQKKILNARLVGQISQWESGGICWGNYYPLGKWAYARTKAQLILLAQLDPLSH